MKTYKPIGDDKQGWKITIPKSVKRADLYMFVREENGTLKYVPFKIPSGDKS